MIEQRELTSTLEHEQLTLHVAALRHDLRKQIEGILGEAVKFKMHVQKSLEDYEGFVVEEVEAELGDEEEEEQADEWEGGEGEGTGMRGLRTFE